MLFSSSVFLLMFLPAVLFGYFILLRGKRPLQNIFLLCASLFFYAWGEPAFVFVMMASIAANYLLGLWMDRVRTRPHAKKIAAVCAAVLNLSLLFVFKYLGFVMRSLNSLTGFSLPVPEIALPVGISFFTFQALSYVLDVGRGVAPVQKNPLWVGLYISFFPQLIAGPIVKYQTVAEEISCRKHSWADFSAGLCRFALGLIKKILLANSLALVADRAFAAQALPFGLAWLGSLAYTFQIFFDFAGYSDMAIGLGQMFGFHFQENFRYPYIARSVTDFWRRWHISLSQWFRDYVYIPLGGSRAPLLLRYRNLFIVWLLTGIWHGANWTFILWGLYYFVLLAAEKAAGLHKNHLGIWRILPTFLVVNFGWVLFRADSISVAGRFLAAMFGLGPDGLWNETAAALLRDYGVLFAAAVVFSAPVAKRLAACRCTQGRAGALLWIAGLLAAVLAAFSFLAKGAYNPFIYFNF